MKRFPRGLRAISDHARTVGAKTLVWFEPERVAQGTWLAQNHPDWLLGRTLLNLGRVEVRNWLTDHVDRVLREQDIGLYRQDFNMAPLSFWRNNDPPDRQGMTENQHIQNYLAYWDELRRRHPNLIIDSCASGCRRNDLETMRRAIALHPTDYNYGHLAAKQAFHSSLFQWLPCFGSNTVPVDTVKAYAFRSGHAMNVVLGCDLRRKELDYDLLRKLAAEWRRIVPYYQGDFYPLTRYSRDEERWLAWQFDRPEQGDGIIEAFRHEKTEEASATFHLSATDPSARYEITDLDSGRSASFSGRELTEHGLPLVIKAKPGALVVRYRRLSGAATALAALETEKTRRVLDLNGTWQVEQGEMQAMPSAFTHTVVVPGLIDMARPSFTTVGKPSSLRRAFWYRRTFKLEGAVPEVALLKIHKARYGTRVILNGQDLGEHQPCFTPGLFRSQGACQGRGGRERADHPDRSGPGMPSAGSAARLNSMNSIPHSPFRIQKGRNNPARAGGTPLAGSAPSLGRDCCQFRCARLSSRRAVGVPGSSREAQDAAPPGIDLDPSQSLSSRPGALYDGNDRADCPKATAGDRSGQSCLGRACFPGPRNHTTMSRSRPFASLPSTRGFGALIVAFAVVGPALLTPPLAPAQGFGGQSAVAQEIKIKSPVASQVFQHNVNGRAVSPLALDESAKDATLVDAAVVAENQDPTTNKQLADRVTLFQGKHVGVPVGGPCKVNLAIKKNNQLVMKEVGPVFVGDLWVLAGQSNMEGMGDLIDVTPPHPMVMSLGMNGKWARAEEPLHWRVDSPDPVHSGHPNDHAGRSAQQHRTRSKGAGLGLPFAVALVEQTRVPIGLVACAHGGTSMEQWNPAKKPDGGNSLYGSFLRQIQLAGGKVRGVLWYQGESDALGGDAWKVYHRVFADFIASVRADLNQPDLPFYYVQIGRFIKDGDPKGWNAVQEVQRRLPERVTNIGVVSVIDLELDDSIHVGTHGLKRTGARLARIAERELFGQIGATTPSLDRVSRGTNNTLIVKFKGVNMRIGMGGMGGGRMGGMGAGMGGMGAGMGGMGGMGGGGAISASMAMVQSPGEPSGLALRPERHIAGFSIRKEDGTPIPLIFDAAVGNARDTVVLKLAGPVPEKASLWYGYGLDPYCNLTDGADMAVPVFGPIALDEMPDFKAPAVATALAAAPASSPAPARSPRPSPRLVPEREPGHSPPPVKLLIITGDHGHDWKEMTKSLKQILSPGGKIAVDVTTTSAKDLTGANLARYDVLLLNYKDTPGGAPETKWSDANKAAFLKAIRRRQGARCVPFRLQCLHQAKLG